MLEKLVSGKFLRPHGLKGEIGLDPYASSLERYLALKVCYAENSEGQVLSTLEVVGVRLELDKVYLRFKGLDDRDAVASLTNLYLAVDRSAAAPLAKNQYYVADILACKAVAEPYGDLGVVKDILLSSPQPVLRIHKAGEADLYVPFFEETKLRVDLAEQTIYLRLPEGLYEIYR